MLEFLLKINCIYKVEVIVKLKHNSMSGKTITNQILL